MARRKKNATAVSFFSFQDILIGTIGIVLMMTIILILLIGKEFIETTTELEDRKNVVLDRRPELEDEVKDLQRDVRDLESVIATDRTLRRLEIRRALLDYLKELEQTKDQLEERRSTLEELANEAKLDARAIRALELMKVRDELRQTNMETRLNPRVTYQLADSGGLEPIIIEIARTGIILSSINQSESEIRFDLPDTNNMENLAKTVLQFIAGSQNLQNKYLLFVVKPSGIPMFSYLQSLVYNHPTLGPMQQGYDLLTERHSISETFDAGGEP